MTIGIGGRKLLRTAMMAGTALLCAATLPMRPQVAKAQESEAEIAYMIPAQPLTSALTQFARQSGLTLAYGADLTRGRAASALVGTFTPSEALARLLAGSGLVHQFTGGRTVTITGPSSGGAATGGGDAEGAIDLEVIDVEARVNPLDEPYGKPGSVSYITREQIDRFPGSSAGDIFKSTPGVISASNRNGAAMDVNIRGLQGENRVKVSIDGTQQSTTTWRGYYGVDERVYIDPDLIGGVGVEKGPTGGAEGAGVIGGVVSIRTLNARDIVKEGHDHGVRMRVGTHDNAIDPAPPLTFDQRLDAPTFGDFANNSGSLALATVSENFDFVAAAARRRSGNYFAGTDGRTSYVLGNTTWPLSFTKPGEEVFNSSQDVFSALAKATFRYDGHSLELGYMRYDNRFGEVLQSVLSTQDNAFRQVELAQAGVDTYTARYRWKPDGDWFDVRFNAWMTRVEATTRSVGPALYFPQFGYIPADDPRYSETTTYGTDLTNTSRIDTAFGSLNLNYGASYSLEDMDGAPYISRIWTRDRGTIMNPSVGTREIGSTFAKGEWEPVGWLTFAAGLRYDTFRLEDHSAPGTSIVGDYSEKSGGRVNPSASVTVKPWDGLQLFALYAEGVRPPSLRESVGSDSLLYPNPDLRPEVAKNWEFGVNLMKDGLMLDTDKARLKVSYFINNYDDYISRVYTTPDMPTDAVFTTRNLESASFSGVEISGSYDAGIFFGEAAFTYYDFFEFCQTSTTCVSGTINGDFALNHMPPDYTTSLTFGLRLLDEKLTVGGRVIRNGERLTPITQTERQRTGYWLPYSVVDLFATYKFDEVVSLDVKVDNLFDRYYIDALEGSMPSPGRTVRASLTAHF